MRSELKSGPEESVDDIVVVCKGKAKDGLGRIGVVATINWGLRWGFAGCFARYR
jgi:hypothetical protein